MFIEFKPGEKHAKKNAEISETMDAFQDCGYLLTSEDVIIDIDHLRKESIEALIKEFDLKTEVVWTDRGAHLYFKKPANWRKRKDGICKLGFEIEQHTKTSRPDGITRKLNGKARTVINEGLRMYLPDIFTVGTKKMPFKDLTDLEEGEGRNKALFAHRRALNDCQGWEKMLSFINRHVFADPLDDKEFQGLVRDVVINNNSEDEKYNIASRVITECNTAVYSGLIWWRCNGEYVSDPKNQRLIRKVYSICEGETTRYVDEVIKQIYYRSKLFPEKTVFPIKFRNGIVKNGKFIQIGNYEEFTPFDIDIDYCPNTQPVPVVDAYIDELTSGDKDYRDLLMEVLGYVMITDPERIRSLGKFFMFRGDGANGKGTLLQIMKTIYGEDNCTNLSIKQLTDDKFKVSMIGKLANLGDDIEPEAINNDQLKVLKNISTADTVATRHMYAESISATFTIKLYFTTNSDIKSFEKGYAYKRRIVWLPMFNKVENPDPYFITKITTEDALRYWIKLIVEGYQRLYQNRRWTECQIVKDYNDQYHESNNAMAQFAKDLDPDTEILNKTIREMKDAFYEWNTDDRTWSPKLFREAVWDLYQMGIGVVKVNGKTVRQFLKQSSTSQKLQH